LYADGDISKAVGDADFFVHKVMHAVKGAGEGFIIGGEKGIAPGVLGAAISEVVADIMAPTAGIAQKELSADQVKSGGSRPRGYGQKYTNFDIKRAQCIAKISVGALSFAAGFSVEEINIAMESAATSMAHNFEKSAKKVGVENEEKEEEGSLTIGGKKFKGKYDAQTPHDSGYESDTTKALRNEWIKRKTIVDDSKARGEKPGFWKNLAVYDAEQAFHDRLVEKQGNYSNYRAAVYAKDHPGQVLAYTAGGAAILASMVTTGGLATAALLGGGGGALIELGNKGGSIQSVQDVKDIGKATLLGAIPGAKLRVMLPVAAGVTAAGLYCNDDMLTYGGGAAGGVGLLGKGVSVAAQKYYVSRGASEVVQGLDLAASKKLIQDSHYFQKHHIISDKHPKTANHDLWKAAGMNPNDPSNLMNLPTIKGSQIGRNNRSVHQGRHLGEVNTNLAEKMEDAFRKGERSNWTQSQYADALTSIINAEKEALKAGVRMLNKHARPNAKRISDLEG
jgi:hypothetical protein